MLGSNPSADSVADRCRGMLRHPPFAISLQKLPIGRGTKGLNPGSAGAKPPQARLAANFLLKHGHPLKMHYPCQQRLIPPVGSHVLDLLSMAAFG
jgi:hypothetical protein